MTHVLTTLTDAAVSRKVVVLFDPQNAVVWTAIQNSADLLQANGSTALTWGHLMGHVREGGSGQLLLSGRSSHMCWLVRLGGSGDNRVVDQHGS